jgi:hypothetical protein
MVKFSNLTNTINKHKEPVSLYYYAIFFFRRLIYVSVPVVLFWMPYLQVQLLVFFHSLYMIFYVSHHCHYLPKFFKLEVLNECFVMVISYHMLLFSDFIHYSELMKF